MSAVRRPSDETLAAFSAGRLDGGLALVVAAHIEKNAESRRQVQDFEAVQGELLDRAEPAAMAGSAWDAIEKDRSGPAPDKLLAAEPDLALAAEPDLPQVLAPFSLGKWRSIGFRIALRRVDVPGAQARVFLLRAGPGIALPHHKHTGFEWTTILSGAYEHQYGRFAAGDFDEADSEQDHTPRVDAVEGCTCIVGMTGNVQFQGWLGRLLQPLVRL